MPEESKKSQSENEPKRAYQPPVVIEYGTLAELTGGKTVTGSDLLPGAKR